MYHASTARYDLENLKASPSPPHTECKRKGSPLVSVLQTKKVAGYFIWNSILVLYLACLYHPWYGQQYIRVWRGLVRQTIVRWACATLYQRYHQHLLIFCRDSFPALSQHLLTFCYITACKTNDYCIASSFIKDSALLISLYGRTKPPIISAGYRPLMWCAIVLQDPSQWDLHASITFMVSIFPRSQGVRRFDSPLIPRIENENVEGFFKKEQQKKKSPYCRSRGPGQRVATGFSPGQPTYQDIHI